MAIQYDCRSCHQAVQVSVSGSRSIALGTDLASRLISKSHTLSLGRENHLKASSKQHALELILQEIPGVTPSGSVGIAEEWKSFKRLMMGFEQRENEEGLASGKVLLEGCKVGLHAVPHSLLPYERGLTGKVKSRSGT